MAVHGNNEIRPRREVAVNRSHPDASLRCDITHRRFDTGPDKHGGGSSEQCLLIAQRVGSLLPNRFLLGWLFLPLVNTHRFIPSFKQHLTNGTSFRIICTGALLHFLIIA
jgi:hypothetical protein